MAFAARKRLTLQMHDLSDQLQNLNDVQQQQLPLIEPVCCRRKTEELEAEVAALKHKVWEFEVLKAVRQKEEYKEEDMVKKKMEEALAFAEEAVDQIQDDAKFLLQHLEFQASVLAQEEKDMGKLKNMLLDYTNQRAKHHLHDPASRNSQKSVSRDLLCGLTMALS